MSSKKEVGSSKDPIVIGIMSSKKEVGSSKDPIVIGDDSDDEETNQPNNEETNATMNAAVATAASQMPVGELKRILCERGVNFSDCLEKRDLVKRLESSSSSAVASSEDTPQNKATANLSVNQLKSLLSDRGIDFCGCIEKSDLVKRLERGEANKRHGTPSADAKKTAAKRRKSSTAASAASSHVMDCPIKLFKTNLDLQNPTSRVINENCLTLRQMLGLDASTPHYQTDSTIDWLVMCNFLVDFDYVLHTVPEFYSVPTCVVFYGEGQSPSMKQWERATDVDYINLKPSDPPKSPTNPLKYSVSCTAMFGSLTRLYLTFRLFVRTHA
jgi:predicted HTH domain antitoxin